MKDETQELLDRFTRHVLAFSLNRVFYSMFEAAAHLDHVINDHGFSGSKLLGSGPYYVFVSDEKKPRT